MLPGTGHKGMTISSNMWPVTLWVGQWKGRGHGHTARGEQLRKVGGACRSSSAHGHSLLCSSSFPPRAGSSLQMSTTHLSHQGGQDSDRDRPLTGERTKLNASTPCDQEAAQEGTGLSPLCACMPGLPRSPAPPQAPHGTPHAVLPVRQEDQRGYTHTVGEDIPGGGLHKTKQRSPEQLPSQKPSSEKTYQKEP